MSIENHPNINAAGFTIDVISAYLENLRGVAGANPTEALIVLHPFITEFIANVSTALDDKFGA